ncbi:hypothetical protein Mp_5g06220 [Marchantia polymorpha subsp. ruderalis]|uniref:Uncharacterized protein n=2 Tax=Marchantia polymorpha TaxID=3197 RepID=A0AAF6BFI0_MARPO|nr:hypothetical protein MARPO_0027s0006 [Marchantia polymorpha]BBN10764.1 hypothetical protein Mp_5g06220 [Marchantia polymorpha subsp. ruderalis]|eukprot:PTQ42870.1 hypothetical protein MARPO_0027s0006 [Marchantia polymorpha]
MSIYSKSSRHQMFRFFGSRGAEFLAENTSAFLHSTTLLVLLTHTIRRVTGGSPAGSTRSPVALIKKCANLVDERLAIGPLQKMTPSNNKKRAAPNGGRDTDDRCHDASRRPLRRTGEVPQSAVLRERERIRKEGSVKGRRRNNLDRGFYFKVGDGVSEGGRWRRGDGWEAERRKGQGQGRGPGWAVWRFPQV